MSFSTSWRFTSRLKVQLKLEGSLFQTLWLLFMAQHTRVATQGQAASMIQVDLESSLSSDPQSGPEWTSYSQEDHQWWSNKLDCPKTIWMTFLAFREILLRNLLQERWPADVIRRSIDMHQFGRIASGDGVKVELHPTKSNVGFSWITKKSMCSIV